MQLTKKLIGTELQHFGHHFNEQLNSNIPLLHRILQNTRQYKGKQVRPMFVLLCAQLGGPINPQSYRAAVVIEMLHTASLAHDDLIDESTKRRGAFTINTLWKNKMAVLIGDHLFTKAILIALNHGDHTILQLYSDAIRQTAQGELLQLKKAKELNLDENVYYEIIQAKTAAFVAAACAAGGSSTFTDPLRIEQLRQFGEKAGMAFQIKDDLLDYSTDDIGKPTGNDIQEKKITLPLLYTLNTVEPRLRHKLLFVLRRRNKNKEKVAWVVAEVIKAGGLQYAETKMLAFRQQAFDILQTFPDSDTKDALIELVRYATERTY